jgi:tetratricopeptide (TPR) repeat protein
MIRHLSEDEVTAIATNDSPDHRSASHIEECFDCRRRVDEYLRLIAMLGEPEVWSSLDEQMHREDLLAKEIAAMTAEARECLAHAPFSPVLLRAGLTVARELLRRAPKDSLRLIEILGETLTRSGIRRMDLAGEIKKERAHALRRLAKFAESLNALNAAERAFRDLPAPFYELAFIDWGKATLSFQTKQYKTALTQANSARSVFLDFGDEISAAEVQLLRGAIAFDQGDLATARRAFEESCTALEPYGERPALALAYQNLCTCDLRLGDLSSARASYESAVPLFKRFGMTVESVRLSWSIAEAFAARGERDVAWPYLDRAAVGFLSMDMEADAAELGLDILEQLVALRQFEAAARLAVDVVSVSTRTGVAQDVAQELAYLTEAIRGARATPAFVRAIKTYMLARREGKAVAAPSLHDSIE